MLQDELDQIYKTFLRWYAMPATTRDPATIPEFCAHHQITLAVIAGFQQRDEFTEDVYRAAIDWGKSKVPELLHMLLEKYQLSKNPNDLRMYKDLLSMDKSSMKEESKDDSDRKGLLRELFHAAK